MKPIILVTGMHRSGTSLVAGLLKLCRAYLGTNLLSGLRDNPKGHFEDRTFVRINDNLLALSGGSWHTPPDRIIDPDTATLSEMNRFVAQWPQDRIVAWKDPRACLTLQLWHRVVTGQGRRMRVVFVNRTWKHIAQSLQVRNGFQTSRGMRLAHRYVAAALRAFDETQVPWHPVHYENFFVDWRAELAGICEFTGLRVPDDSKAIEEFIDPGLRHHRGD